MPQLPSGLHFALDPTPVAELIRLVSQAKAVHELMAIETIEHLYPHIEVMFFRSRQASGQERQYSEFSAAPPEDLEPYASGFTLHSIQTEFQNWSPEDQVAFAEILHSPRTQSFLQRELDEIMAMKEELRANPTTLAGMLASYWRMGCHPLQEPLDSNADHE
ncbi:hypothetical protein EI77_03672 [Prosthecobacter fusiformis]|uniref:Uncharacterized protein n=1 Tax=Prosthecobacter fusiformis TaxID=48464 RepID=A0A4R7RQL7_9BACT|nr:hypothetical protein [Prosthecobacter fusiformis]TDU66577.1 hypothetical protein EI77_03672 [Prosthecobacter fusiformis]